MSRKGGERRKREREGATDRALVNKRKRPRIIHLQVPLSSFPAHGSQTGHALSPITAKRVAGKGANVSRGSQSGRIQAFLSNSILSETEKRNTKNRTTLMPIPQTPKIPNAQCSNFSSVLSNIFRLRAQKEVDMMLIRL